MPLTWVIDHQTRMVVATGEGTIRLEDFEAALDELARPATLSYRKLLDLTHCSSVLGAADMLDLSARIRGYSALSTVGALAIVAASDENYRKARLFEAVHRASRPMKIFSDAKAAREWLDTVPSPPSRYERLFDAQPDPADGDEKT